MRYSFRTKECVKPLRSRLEAIQKLQPATTVKGCRSFAGMANFLSIFCPALQKLLKPIYDLTRKGNHLFGEKNNKNPLKRLNLGSLDLQFYIRQIPLVDFIYILTPVNLLWKCSLPNTE